jgi:casein kinase 1, epsilon
LRTHAHSSFLPLTQTKDSLFELDSEIKALQQIGDQVRYVPRLLSYGLLKEKRLSYLAQERLGPSLKKVLSFAVSGISLENAFVCLRQLIHVISLVHSVGWLHCNIKPNNIVLGSDENGDHLFLVDFGLGRRYLGDLADHCAYEENTALDGSSAFVSVHTHMGIGRCGFAL